MPWAVVGAAAVGAAGSIYSSNKAAGAQKDAADASTALQQGIYNDTVSRNQPFVQGGTSAFNALMDRFGLAGNGTANSGTLGHVPTAEEVMAQPGYQFGLDQGQNALNRQLNARGMSYSGAQLKAANMFGNNYATGQYQNAFNNLQAGNQQVYNQLMGAAGMGQASANNTASAGQQFGAQAGNNMQGGANAQAANYLAQGNALQGLANQGASAYKNYQANQTPNSSSAWGGGTGGTGSSGSWGGSVSEPWYG